MQLDPQSIAVMGTCWVLAVGLHEAGHAYTADWLGDDTPSLHGRLTLNPFAHLKPVYTAVILPFLFLAFGGGLLGGAWTPINPSNFRHPLRDRVFVALAGPSVNLLLAGIFTGLFFVSRTSIPAQSLAWMLLFYMVHLNLVLFLFNLLPIPGLDGGDVVRYFLPPGARESFDGMRQYGIIIAIILLSIPKVRLYFFLPVYLYEALVFGAPDAR